MRHLIFASVCLLTTALTGCQQTPPANDQLDAVLWTQTSIEHELIYRQLFANATRQLDVALADPTWDALPFPPRNLNGLPPALVVDIDETLLDNVPLNARDVVNNQVYSYDRWNTWVDQAKAQALPGSVAFLQAAQQKGIKVYYLTNREHSQVAATVKNLRLRGFPIESNEQILAASTPTGHCESAGYGKNCRRQWVATHARVLLMAGDSLGDHVRIDVGGQDAEIQFGRLGQDRQDGHGHRIGFLTVRAGGRPQADPLAATGALGQTRHDLVAQVFEMVGLAEEAGDVGRQGGRHQLALVHAVRTLHQFAVVSEAAQTQGPQPLGEARIDQRGLAVVQGDTGIAVQDFGDVAEVLGGEDELAFDQGLTPGSPS